ncbi:MAG: 4-hydroxy-3-methylbut-2-en-yl diphosphate reductase, partial [Shewanella sp.]|nr:4-hydroxy-3-methylbut-2-en-yl diphosphate reductase [Shewanella sp.]
LEDVAQLQVKNPQNLCFVTQTTLSVDDTMDIIAALQQRFPCIEGPRKDDICYATQNRQDAVRKIASDVELLIVVGSRNSSNSNRLRELAEKSGTRAYLLDNADDIDATWFNGVGKVAVTAGASAPEVLVQQVVEAIATLAPSVVTEVEGRQEDTVFAVPAELR